MQLRTAPTNSILKEQNFFRKDGEEKSCLTYPLGIRRGDVRELKTIGKGTAVLDSQPLLIENRDERGDLPHPQQQYTYF